MTGERLVAIVVHDVAPATWPQCRTLLGMIDALGAPPVTLLVVPHFHRRARARDSREFIDAMHERRARGDELVLHGCFHVDDAPAPRGLRDFVARRVLTRGEAEFAAISGEEARKRMQQGIALFHDLGWPLHGFVPPAWQLNDATRRVLDSAAHRFDYVPVKQGIYRLPGWNFEATANYCYSPDRRWRRAMSRAQIAIERARHGNRRLLRLSLHPLDARFAPTVAHWRRLITAALASRRAVTKHQAMTPGGTPPYADMLSDLGGKLSGT
ncbi:MAG: polysaccharide deacetylase family protein [Betaproteobacteria bacterium]